MAMQNVESVPVSGEVFSNSSSDMVRDKAKNVRTRSLSLVGKLAAACDAVGGVEKKGVNEMQKYKYVKAADVAKAIRHELFSRGVIIMCNELSFEKSGEITTKSGGILREFLLTVEYTIHDADSDEKITSKAFGVAMDSGDKAKYKCSTGALKYFLRGLGLIPDEKDDPEADESVDKIIQMESNEEFDQHTADQQCIALFQVNAIKEACVRSGKTEEETLAYLGLIGHKRIEHLLKSEFQKFLQWANTKAQVNPKEFVASTKEAFAAGSAMQPASKIVPPKDTPRTKAMKRLWATAAELHIEEAEVKSFAYKRFRVDSMTLLNEGQLDETTDQIKTWLSHGAPTSS